MNCKGRSMSHSTNRRAFLSSTLLATAASRTLASNNAEADSDQRSWVRAKENPLLSLGKPGEFDSQNIMSPAVVKHGGKYFMFYAGGPFGPRNNGGYVQYQLGLALSNDGKNWTKQGPLLKLGKRDNFHVTPALLRNPAGDLSLIHI